MKRKNYYLCYDVVTDSYTVYSCDALLEDLSTHGLTEEMENIPTTVMQALVYHLINTLKTPEAEGLKRQLGG
jgi:hypothetical protein